MKRIKIMLLSFALLAVVGGALAFKARFTSQICYTTTTALTTVCATTPFVGTTTNGAVFIKTSYTTTPVDFGPGIGQKCYITDPNDPQATISLTCNNTVKVKANN
jgi:hypothetical protein